MRIIRIHNRVNDPTLIPMDEELKSEQEALKIDEEAIKAEIIKDMELDEVEDADKIDKFVAREVKQRTFTSKAIASKIKTREELDTLKKAQIAKPQEDGNAKQPEKEDVSKLVSEKLNEALEKRDLDAMGYPDDVKAEIKRIAQITGVSVMQAAKDPYIVQTKIEPWEKAQKADNASVRSTHKSSGKQVYDADKVPMVDMSTPEGRKEYDEWLKNVK